jgi:hypothetical protein
MKLNRFKSCIVTVLTAAASLSVRAQQTNKVSARDFSTFKDIVDWNIFDPHRHGPAPAFTPRPPMVDRFWLSGTMSYAKGVYAVFDGTQADFQKVAQAGAKVANYTVTSIGDDSVKLTIGTNEMVLKMGMEMHRSEDGKWTLAESSGGQGFVADSGGQGSGYDQNSDRGGGRRRRGGRFGGNDDGLMGNGGASASYSMPVESTPAPSGAGGNDIVAQMMAKRAAALGGGGNPGAGGPPPGNQGPQQDFQNQNTPPPGTPDNQNATPPTPPGPPDGSNPTSPPAGGSPNSNP